MKTDYFDLFQLHAFDNSTPLSDTIGELEILCKKGMIRSFGVSNFDPKQLSQVNKILTKSIFKGLAAIECHYNIIERKFHKTSKMISEETKKKINNITLNKNDK